MGQEIPSGAWTYGATLHAAPYFHDNYETTFHAGRKINEGVNSWRVATSVAAAALHLERDVGTIEAGKVADLLVLDKNPLDDIANIRTSRYVMKDGRLFENSALWKIAGFTP